MWSNYGEIKEIKFEVKGGFPAIFDAIFSNWDPHNALRYDVIWGFPSFAYSSGISEKT